MTAASGTDGATPSSGGEAAELAMVAGEASGDVLAAQLLQGLHRRWPHWRAVGIGGAAMQAQGFQAWWSSDRLAVRGYVEELMAWLSPLESPPAVAFLAPLGAPAAVTAGLPTVVLDRLQDPGNVGSILRSAAAFGFRQVLALRGTVALWAPKVLRAGMGAHFALQLVEGAQASALAGLGVPLLATSSHQGEFLHAARLPWPKWRI